jgi:hypothetical protein
VAVDVGGGDVRGQHRSRALKLLRRSETPACCSRVPSTPRRVSAPFRGDQVAVGPAHLGAEALAGAVADLARDGARRRGFQAVAMSTARRAGTAGLHVETSPVWISARR